jgi:hypothetical protein
MRKDAMSPFVLARISQTYDHHDFFEEKRRGFQLLATRLHIILNPPDNNVVALPVIRGQHSNPD